MTLKVSHSPQQQYDSMIQNGIITPDAAQTRAIAELDKIYHQLTQEQDESSSLFFWKKKKTANANNLYIWGDVGRGKTMLMDVFVDCLPEHIHSKRIHFHAFMSDIHERLHQQRTQNLQGNDPLAMVAAKYMGSLEVLCLDEFQVHDIADAMILSRLFTMLLSAGVTVIATSNRRPDDLYLNGLQREQFLPFIDLLKNRFIIHELLSSTDYRLQKLRSHGSYFTPANNQSELEEMFEELTNHSPRVASLHVKGRTLLLDRTADGIAWCSFDELCRKPLGASDYSALAAEFHTIILTDIPQMGADECNEAKRFVTLIDTLYEHHTNLLCSADAQPEALYTAGDGSFEFQRTASRLYEMQSEEYQRHTHEV